MDIIDLSQEIYEGMPAFGDHPHVKIEVAVTHEQRQNLKDAETVSPVVHKIQITEHSGTHVDAFNHFGIPFRDKGIDTMPLEMFYTMGVCLDFSEKKPLELISPAELETAIRNSGTTIDKGDTVLIYTDHYRRFWNTENWNNGPGLSLEAVEFLADSGVYAFGVETRSPGVLGQGNKEIHTLCGERNFTHYENLINLFQLTGRGKFRFIALPLKIRNGTGSPVRAVAVFE